jgi:hypothetical protein
MAVAQVQINSAKIDRSHFLPAFFCSTILIFIIFIESVLFILSRSPCPEISDVSSPATPSGKTSRPEAKQSGA